MPTEYTEVVVDELVQMTENALLCDFEDIGEEWIPKSLVEDLDNDLAIGDKNFTISIATWKAKELNLH